MTRFLASTRDFLFQSVQAGSGTQPTSSSLGTGGRFLLKRPRHEACHSALLSAEVKNVWSYTSSPTIRLNGVNRDNSTSLIVVAMAGGKGDKGVLTMPSPYRALKYRAPKLLIAIYSLSSLFVGSYFVVSHIRRVAPTRKVHHSNSSVDSSVEIFRQLGGAFGRHRMMFKELTGKTEAAVITMFLLRNENNKKY